MLFFTHCTLQWDLICNRKIITQPAFILNTFIKVHKYGTRTFFKPQELALQVQNPSVHQRTKQKADVSHKVHEKEKRKEAAAVEVPEELVQGGAKDNAGDLNHIELYFSFLYLLCRLFDQRFWTVLQIHVFTVGLGVVAMNYYLLREEVMVRSSQIRKKITECRAKIKYSLKTKSNN